MATFDWTKLANPLEAAKEVAKAQVKAQVAEQEVQEIKATNKIITSGDVANKSESGAEIEVDIAELDKKAKKKVKKFIDETELIEAKEKLNKKLPSSLGEALWFPETKKITPELKLEWVKIFFKEIRKQYAGNSKKVKLDAGNWAELDAATKLEVLKSQYKTCMDYATGIKKDETGTYNVKAETYRIISINPAFLQLINKNAISNVGVEGV